MISTVSYSAWASGSSRIKNVIDCSSNCQPFIKNSYDFCLNESVDDISLSYALFQKSTDNRIIVIIPDVIAIILITSYEPRCGIVGYLYHKISVVMM